MVKRKRGQEGKKIKAKQDGEVNSHNDLVSMHRWRGGEKGVLSALGATELKSSLSKPASCLEVAEGKCKGLLENLTPSCSKLREDVFVSPSDIQRFLLHNF